MRLVSERSGHGRLQIMGTTDDNVIKRVPRRVREELPHRRERLIIEILKIQVIH